MTPELLQLATGCTPDKAKLYAPHLAETCAAYGIDTPERQAAFLAQLAHESGGFRYVAELWGPTPEQARYEGRADLGNNQPGDGFRYRGRGLIQTTGRYNYAATTLRMRPRFGPSVPDFEAEPDALMQPRWACLSAGDYWADRKLNALADAGKFIEIGRAINRGSPNSTKAANGEADRLQRWERAKAALAVGVPAPLPMPTITTTINPAPAPTPEPDMDPFTAVAVAKPALDIITTLGRNLIDAFKPLAAEKIQKEMARHTDNPAVAEQITAAVVDAAKAATGRNDPIEAVAEVKKDPVAMQQVEQSTLERLQQMAPLLERLDALDRAQFADEEGSRDAAVRRAQTDTMKDDMGRVLVFGGLGVVGALLIFVGSFVGIQLWRTGEVDQFLSSTLTLLIGWATAKVGSIYDYRFGSSRGSATKDAVIADINRRP